MDKRTVATFIQRWPLPFRLAQIAWRRVVPPWMTAGAVGAVYNDAGAILLVEHVFHPKCPWGLPGGWMNRNEDPAQTVTRELREETGLTVAVERPLIISGKSELRHHLDIGFLCHAESDEIHLSSELMDYRWVRPGIDAVPPLMMFHKLVFEVAATELRKQGEV